MQGNISKDIKILAFSFFLIFFGYNGVQQYITTFFSEKGFKNIGFYSLLVIYIFLFLFSFLAIFLSLKFSLKKLMAFSSLTYTFFVFSLLSYHYWILYAFSALLGVSAAFLWTAQRAFLIRKSNKKNYGKNSGFFVSLQRLGSFLGIVFFSFLLSRFSFGLSIFLYAVFPFLGFLMLLVLKEPERQALYFNFRLIDFLNKIRKAKILPRLSLFYFCSGFILGLILGTIPFQIRSILDPHWIGIITSPFYIFSFLLAFPAGLLSDVIGRKNIIILGYLFLISGMLSLYFGNSFFPILLGIILLSIGTPFVLPASISLIGDVGSERNFEIIGGFFLGIGSLGTVVSLLLGLFLREGLVYIISIIIAVLTLWMIVPILNIGKEKLLKEVIYETEIR